MVIWGTWFRLTPKEEFYKLTRIQVDIPNTLDHLWSLDIKKSSAYPPESIRQRLLELIPHFTNTSQRTITYPGRKQRQTKKFIPLWERIEPAHNLFKYQINENHPAIQAFCDNLSHEDIKRFQNILELTSVMLPYESIYSDMCSDNRQSKLGNQEVEIIAIARRLLTIAQLPLEHILKIDPIASYPQYHDKIRMEINE